MNTFAHAQVAERLQTSRSDLSRLHRASGTVIVNGRGHVRTGAVDKTWLVWLVSDVFKDDFVYRRAIRQNTRIQSCECLDTRSRNQSRNADKVIKRTSFGSASNLATLLTRVSQL